MAQKMCKLTNEGCPFWDEFFKEKDGNIKDVNRHMKDVNIFIRQSL